jgi:zinc finger SWIM domain-containing protein 3
MNRYHALHNKSNRALFKVSRNQVKTERVMKLLDEILNEDPEEEEHETEEGMSFGPLPAHFSGANQPCGEKLRDPVKIISRGAPRSNKRWKPSHEM